MTLPPAMAMSLVRQGEKAHIIFLIVCLGQKVTGGLQLSPPTPLDNVNLSTPTRFDKVGLIKEGFHLFVVFINRVFVMIFIL